MHYANGMGLLKLLGIVMIVAGQGWHSLLVMAEPPPTLPAENASPQQSKPSTNDKKPQEAPDEFEFLDSKVKYEGKSLDEWVAMLNDQDEFRRMDAANAVGKYGPNAKATVPALVKLLKDPDSLVVIKAVVALGKIGPAAREAVAPLMTLLKKRIVVYGLLLQLPFRN